MTRRTAVPRQRPSAITPDSHVTLSIKQILVALGGVVVGASGYFYLVSNQTAAQRDIAEIKTNVAAVTSNTQSASKDQDAKREQLGKDFLASTNKIADEVNMLNAAMIHQQDQTATMNNTLVTISNQLGELSRPQKTAPPPNAK